MGLVQGIATQPSWQDCSELVVRGRNESRVVGLDTSGCVQSALGSPPPRGGVPERLEFCKHCPSGSLHCFGRPPPYRGQGQKEAGRPGWGWGHRSSWGLDESGSIVGFGVF